MQANTEQIKQNSNDSHFTAWVQWPSDMVSLWPTQPN